MKKLISLFAVLFFLLAVQAFAGANPQLEKFGARWIDGTSQFEVFAAVNIIGVSEDFFFSWSASGAPMKNVSHYGGRAVIADGVIIGNTWYFRKIYQNKLDFLALQFSGLVRDDKTYDKDIFNLVYKNIIQSPAIPSNPNPPNGTSGQKEIVVRWSGGDPNGLPIIYTVLWGYTQSVNSFQSQTTDTFLVLSNWKKFPVNKTFYWRVIADNGFIQTAGPTWVFDTYDINVNVSNYPNPFNPITTINYEIVKDADVQLTVYNMIGQQVAILVNRRQSPGEYSAKFNANNLASGIYIYRLKVGGSHIIQKRMILLK